MTNFTCVIIDDEPLARSLVKEYLQAFPNIEIKQECNDGFEGVKAIATHQPDLIFLDIQMPKINGFEMLELVENPPAVIFTTAFDAYAMKAFEAHALDYLLKPFSKERFNKAIEKMMQVLGTKSEKPSYEKLTEEASNNEEILTRLVVKHHHAVQVLSLQDILYLEAYGDYIKIHTANQIYLKKKTMNYFEQHLPAKDFIRVHRSYIIPSNSIQKIDPPDFVILRNGEKVPVSKTGYSKLKTVLGL
ncbi:MAG: LytTR family transcriptional regulator DNA-binding domain-containing protein [Bacteroidia bacterium]|nr:LytTR family transcriptional regulator DNA-binding domain-containing protein [Bacteroidia bacterium]MCF8426937.1 LytTR family transcriptional regulator DNA-binding domain-containing protein [Bacteroidia bacterium]MCF8446821.1 LytTR family transcriptional regulator DNA-binding domain-containing protein [Bacteroidia bacterium]